MKTLARRGLLRVASTVLFIGPQGRELATAAPGGANSPAFAAWNGFGKNGVHLGTARTARNGVPNLGRCGGQRRSVRTLAPDKEPK